ncbi:MAG: hypothetical protein Q8R28_18390 [Dehalococcoidia bacterium]|nr:hypothetical protein [Dehalococcoidia bacterium]
MIIFKTEDSLWQMMERTDWWVPEVNQVAFLNKQSGQILTFEYKGMEFASWAPGWCFLILSELNRGEA